MRVIISISSDIGTALARNWVSSGHEVWGTYRRWSENCDLLETIGVKLEYCDLGSVTSITKALESFPTGSDWSCAVLASGNLEPIGLFHEIDFAEWSNSVQVNFVGQLQFLHGLMQINKELKKRRNVILFAGGATNSATERYSAYTVSKIASIKLCELLDFEYDEYIFTCIGPGWVESKIHDATLKAGTKAGNNFEKTLKLRKEKLMNPVENVIEFCNWIISKDKDVVGGRNFSVVHDAWRKGNIERELRNDENIFKLRRYGNDLKLD